MPHRKKTACPVFLRTGSSVADPAGRAAAYWEDNGLPPEREIQKTSSGDSFQNGAFAQSTAIGLDYLSGSGIVFPAEKHHSVKSQLARFFQTQPEKLCADAAAPAVRAAGAAVIVRFGQLQADINDTDNLFAVASQESESGDSIRFPALPHPL